MHLFNILIILFTLLPSILTDKFAITIKPNELPNCSVLKDVDGKKQFLLNDKELVLLSTIDGKLTTIDTTDGGKLLWSKDTGAGPLLSSTLNRIEMYSNDEVPFQFIPSLDGSLYAIHKNRIRRLPFSAEILLKKSFKFSKDMVITGGKERNIYGLNLQTGEIQYSCGGMEGCRSGKTDAGPLLIAVRETQTVRGIDPLTGVERWNLTVADFDLSLGQGADCTAFKDDDIFSMNKDPINYKVNKSAGELQAYDKTKSHIWSHQLKAPIVQAWVIKNGIIKPIDLFDPHIIPEQDLDTVPSYFLGNYKNQRYIQQSFLQKKPLEITDDSSKLEEMFTSVIHYKEVDENPNLLIAAIDSYLQPPPYYGTYYFEDLDDLASANSSKRIDNISCINHISTNEFFTSTMIAGLIFAAIIVIITTILFFYSKNKKNEGIFDNTILWPKTEKNLASLFLGVSEKTLKDKSDIMEKYLIQNDDTNDLIDETKDHIVDIERIDDKSDEDASKSEEEAEFSELSSVLIQKDPWPTSPHSNCSFDISFRSPDADENDSKDESDSENESSDDDDDDEEEEDNTRDSKVSPRKIYKGSPKLLVNRSNPSEENKRESILRDSRFFREYENFHRLGKGGFGEVFQVCNKLDKGEYAIKTTKLPSNKEKQEKMMREVTVLAKLDHNRIVRYHNCWTEFHNEHDIKEHFKNIPHKSANDSTAPSTNFSDESSFSEAFNRDSKKRTTYLFIQMELCKKNSLRDWLLGNMKRDESVTLDYFLQIVEAVEFVHQMNLVHRDLKPSNIFFSKNDTIKVGDFGLVRDMREVYRQDSSSTDELDDAHSITKEVGTTAYMSPEQLQQKDYNEKVDIYSLGLIFMELMSPNCTDQERIHKITKMREKKEFPKDITSDELKLNLLSQLIENDPEKRLSASQIKEHPLFQQRLERKNS